MRTRILILAILSILLSACRTASADTSWSCGSEFTFLGSVTIPADTSEPGAVFFFAEDHGGECWSSFIIGILTIGTTAISFSRETGYKDWKSFVGAICGLKIDNPLRFEESDGAWTQRDAGFTISDPQPESALFNEFKNIFDHGGDADLWLERKGESAVLLPFVSGVSTKLVYFHRHGLYINYHITMASFFPANGYMLLFTKSAFGGNDVFAGHDGFLILKVEHEHSH